MHAHFRDPAYRRGSRMPTDESAGVADSGRRMRHLAIGFAVCLSLVFLRVAMLECSQGAAFRAAAAKPLEKSRPLPGIRGRILSRDSQVLAVDKRVSSLAVHFRYLEEPPNTRWLRSQARARISRDEPNRATKLAAERAWIASYRAELLDRLARLCGRPVEELDTQLRAIQARVRAIAAAVNRPRPELPAPATPSAQPPADLATWDTLVADASRWLLAPDDRRVPARIVVAEELDYHVLVSDVPLEVVAEVESRPEQYPGVRIVEQSFRQYPHGSLAANVLGHLGLPEERTNEAAASSDTAADAGGAMANKSRSAARDTPQARSHLVGRLGAEWQFESVLRGRDGLLADLTDHSGRWLESLRRAEPASGRDVVLTLDARLQRIAEEHLDRALARAVRAEDAHAPQGGGAIVVLEADSGAILAAATAPRFNPNHFANRDAEAIERLLREPAHPLFDRVTKMAIPPGSVFKIITSLALLAGADFDPDQPFDCQGYLTQPDRQRCQIFRRFGVGHGPTNLCDALVRSCNVYFFQNAERLGPAALVDWGTRLGFGRPTGVDLPGEAAGFLPSPARPGAGQHKWELADTQALAIGQSTLTVTPLQVARMMAAVANGGYLITPHIVAETSGSDDEPLALSQRTLVPGLERRQLDLLRQAIVRVANDPDGTAYAALADTGVAVAGKTGTAETGEKSPDHAWFAGYAPADAPRVALVVVLEHQGSADQAAAVAKELVQALEALGFLVRPDAHEMASDAGL